MVACLRKKKKKTSSKANVICDQLCFYFRKLCPFRWHTPLLFQAAYHRRWEGRISRGLFLPADAELEAKDFKARNLSSDSVWPFGSGELSSVCTFEKRRRKETGRSKRKLREGLGYSQMVLVNLAEGGTIYAKTHQKRKCVNFSARLLFQESWHLGKSTKHEAQSLFQPDVTLGKHHTYWLSPRLVRQMQAWDPA